MHESLGAAFGRRRSCASSRSPLRACKASDAARACTRGAMESSAGPSGACAHVTACFAEYVFIGRTGSDLHSKTKVLPSRPISVDVLPAWHVDGLPGGSGHVQLKPRKMVPDPFRGHHHVLVLCDTFCPPARCQGGDLASRVHASNNRFACCAVMDAASASDPVFACEQQYQLLNSGSLWPVGWPQRASTDIGKSFQYGVGQGAVVGRDFAEAHLLACCRANLKLSGLKADSAPGQWSYTVGPCRGVELGDQLWLSRYLLLRLTEKFDLVASLDPKPVPGDWCCSSAPVKFSTAETRNRCKGLQTIDAHLRSLQQAHLQHMMMYGPGNAKRFTNQNMNSSVMCFTAGIEDQAASVCVPSSTVLNQCGHYQDRRPASNMDPYLVSMMLVCTTLGVPLPLAVQAPGEYREVQDESSSDVASRGTSALIDSIDCEAPPLGPSTPDGMPGALASACNNSSDNHSFTG